jgi:DNA-binding transcriptional regulator YiaG
MKNTGKNKVINELRDLGYSKYRIAKKLNIAYNTVDHWDRGVWQPNEINLAALELLKADGPFMRTN